MIRAVAALGAVAVVLATGGHAAAEPSRQPAPTETLVMPFDNPANEPKLLWLGEGSAVLLSEYLERYGRLAVPREERLAAFNRLQLPPAAALSHATMIKVGQIVSATEIVIGTYNLSGDELTVRARVIRLDTWHMAPEVVERGALTDLFRLYDAVARQLRGATAPAPAAAPGTLLTSLNAFEWYVKGMVAESAAVQRGYLEQAAKAAPSDDRIKLALWRVHTDAGNHQLALAAAATVAPASPQSASARYLTARSQIELRRYDDAFKTLDALRSDTRLAEVLNALGVVQLRRRATSQTGRAAYYFSQASQTDPTDADYFFNLGYAYWLDKDPPAALYWLREAVRLDPADGDAHLVLAAALQQTGATAEAARERELAARLTASSGNTAAAAGETVPHGLERLKEFLDRPNSRVNAMIASAGQRDQTELAFHHLDAGRRAFHREADREAEQELRRALYLSPYLAEAHMLLGRVYFRGGRSADAIQAFRIALWSEETVEGHVRLAEVFLAAQNIPAAREEVARALMLDPNSKDALALRVKIGR
ncbi:MAG TPA: tetratricopeptide repeat protein [Vicinamibacterales bacterium]|nr:tetratricopeptide repeat protein [Vicinamibacterales bacterium]